MGENTGIYKCFNEKIATFLYYKVVTNKMFILCIGLFFCVLGIIGMLTANVFIMYIFWVLCFIGFAMLVFGINISAYRLTIQTFGMLIYFMY